MGHIGKTGYLVIAGIIFLFQSCMKTVDFSGFIYTPEGANERFDNSMEWNLQHPSRDLTVNSGNYTFLVAGDSHCGTTKNLDFFLEMANAPGISFSIIAGDLTTGLKDDYDTVYKHLTSRALKPTYLSVGNHDLFFHGWKTYIDYFGSSTYSFTVNSPSGKDLFICLDSGTATLGSRQLQWLKDLMKTRGNYRNCVIFTHVNFFREHRVESTTLLVEELYALLDLFADNNADLVIMGHDHWRSVENLGSTYYITLDALEDGFGSASYMIVANQNGSIDYKFIEVD